MKTFEREELQSLTDVRKEYPGGVPAKFKIDGSVRHYPGNTIICHLSPDSTLHTQLMKLYRELEANRDEVLYTLLPPPSWHMTVFEGVCDQVRKSGFWPSDLSLDVPLSECNSHFTTKLSAFEMGTEPPFRLRIAGYSPRVDGIGLHLEPITAAEEVRLRRLRDRLAETLNIRHPSHDTYVFHLSIAYFIRFPSDEERERLEERLAAHLPGLPAEFELGAPEFCYFHDMFEFRRQFFLR